MKPLWVIQENLNNDDKKLLPILDKLKIPYKLIQIIPFSDTIPDVEYDGPIVVRGSTTTLRGTGKKDWKPGVFHNDNFKPSEYCKNYGEFFLNRLGEALPLKDAHKLGKTLEHLFIRPNSDYKDLTGEVKSKRDIRKLAKGAAMGHYPFDENLEVWVSPPINIPDEYRFVVVNGKVVSGAQYRRNSQLRYGPASDDAREFAEKMVKIWNPDEVYCLDIGRQKHYTWDYPNPQKVYKLGVIECNCFNASGIYNDSETIVKAVTDYVETTYS